MLYHFEGMGVGNVPNLKYRMLSPKGYSLLDFKQVYTKWDKRVCLKKAGAPSTLATTTSPA